MSQAVPFSILRAAPWGALGVSLVVHLTGLGIGAAIVFSPKSSTTEQNGVVEADIDPVLVEPAPVLLNVGAWQPASSPGGGGRPNPAAMTVDVPLEPQLSGFSVGGPLALGSGEGLSYTDVIGDGGSGGGEGGGIGLGNGTGIGDGDGFFGLDLEGERFVFVVDSSRSMNHPYPGEAKNRLGRVKIELYHTIQKMTPDQSFFVVFFNTEPIPMPATGMVKADPALVGPYLKWIFSTRAMGQTNPESALLAALRVNPDKIYFLTDGDFSYRSVRAAREHNPGRIPIHTIGFGGQGGEKNLQEIARDSQGTYQFIPEPVVEATPAIPAAKAEFAAP